MEEKRLVAQIIIHEENERIKWQFEELKKNEYIIEKDLTGFKIYKNV